LTSQKGRAHLAGGGKREKDNSTWVDLAAEGFRHSRVDVKKNSELAVPFIVSKAKE